MEERIRQLFGFDIESKIAMVDELSIPIAKAGQCLVDALLSDGKILIGAYGASYANGVHFSTALQHRFDVERPALPVIDLMGQPALVTAAIQDGHADHLLARQILTLGSPQDILVLITTSSQSKSLIYSLESAHERGIAVILLTGQADDALATHLNPKDVVIPIPRNHPARIREMHLFVLHCFCDLIERALFGHEGDAI